jgi:hypothetical protein
MVSLLTLDVWHFIEEAKKKSVTAVTLLSNRKKLSRACELPQSGTKSAVRRRFIGSALAGRATAGDQWFRALGLAAQFKLA